MLRDERNKKGQERRSIRKHLGMICSWSWSWQCFHQCIDMSKLITLYIVYELYPKDVWKNKQKVHHQFLEIKSRVYFFRSPKDSVISFYHLVNPFLLFKKKKKVFHQENALLHIEPDVIKNSKGNVHLDNLKQLDLEDDYNVI